MRMSSCIQEISKGVEKQWVLIGNLKLWEFLCDDVLDLVGLKMTLGHVTTGMEIVCYLTKSCIPNLIFSSSFSNCVGTLLMIKIHDPGHPLMHELIEKS